jgi:hypothetical protein
MVEALVWLLVSMPGSLSSYNPPKHTHVVERFVTLEECQRVNKVLSSKESDDFGGHKLKLWCVQARVAVPAN